jgi:hypothetical protein
MASSHRLVCDLLDKRYFDDLQDVVGNVQPIPTLVPYDNYEHNVIVYKTVADHTKFMAMIQNFCDRTARQYGRELWSWVVQWEVEGPSIGRSSGATPAFKKPRIDAASLDAMPAAQPTQRERKPHYTVSRRHLDPELMKEEDMLRIAIDIVQMKPELVPNFIEFLYRWIDFYEGDGMALKLAIHEEIPSLWDFEHTPLVLLKLEEEKNKNEIECKKPDVKAFEKLAAKSERLQYREARFGLQAVKEDDPMPPLINIPKDPEERKKYYAACYKSRDKAKYLLKEAGITERQIGNYVKQQEVHPKKTLEEGEGTGWKWYNSEKVKAEEYQYELQRWAALKKKCKECLMSNKLKSEADQVAIQASSVATQSGPGITAPPLIPPTTPYPLRLQLHSANRKRHIMSQLPDEPIKVVPVHLFGILNSRLFSDANPSDAMEEGSGPESDEENEGMEGTEDGDDTIDTTTSTAHVTSDPSAMQPSAPPARPPQGPVNVTNAVGLLQSLSPAQVMRMLPLLESQDRQRVIQRLMLLPAPHNQALPDNVGVPNPFTAAQLSSELSQFAWGMSNQPSPSASPSIGSVYRSSPAVTTGTAALDPTAIAITPLSQDQQLNVPLPPLRERASAIMQYQASDNDDNGSGYDERTGPMRISDIVVQHMSQTERQLRMTSQLQQHQSPLASVTGNNPFRSDNAQQQAHTVATQRLNQVLQTQDVSQLTPQMAQFQAWANHQRRQITEAANGVQPLQRPAIMPTPTTPLQPNFTRQLPLRTGLSNGIEKHQTAGLLASQGLSTLLGELNRPNSLQLPGPAPSTSFQLPRIASSTSIQRPSPAPLNSLRPDFAPPLPGLKRRCPIGLSITPAPVLAQVPNPTSIPIQLYFPNIAVYASTTIGIDITDALLLGYLRTTPSGDEEIELTHLILLPMSIRQNCINRVQEGQYTVLESYAPAKMRSITGKVYTPAVGVGGLSGKAHRAAYKKIQQAFSFMQDRAGREDSLTKRWRATQGMMTDEERGSVWEGWLVGISMGIVLSKEERRGAVVMQRNKAFVNDEDEDEEDEADDNDDDNDEDMDD